MRLVAISDTHFQLTEEQITNNIPDGDILVHTGDLMYEGTAAEWKSRLKWLSSLPHKHKYYIPGNHDFHPFIYSGPSIESLKKCGIIPLFEGKYHVTLPNGMVMLGLPFVTNLPGWAFNIQDHDIGSFLTERYFHKHIDIVASHAPVYGVLDKLDDAKKTSVGTKAYKKFIDNKLSNIKYWIHGHIHESYGEAEYNGCKFYNVAMCDVKYNIVNKGKVIDL